MTRRPSCHLKDTVKYSDVSVFVLCVVSVLCVLRMCMSVTETTSNMICSAEHSQHLPTLQADASVVIRARAGQRRVQLHIRPMHHGFMRDPKDHQPRKGVQLPLNGRGPACELSHCCHVHHIKDPCFESSMPLQRTVSTSAGTANIPASRDDAPVYHSILFSSAALSCNNSRVSSCAL